jgi:hypothetical protein
MRIDWFRPRQLARRLAAREVSNREVAYLMLANMLFGSILFYSGFSGANPPWTWPTLIEFVTVVTITLVGFTKVYDSAGGDKNPSFPALFNCLTFGVGVWTTFIVWVVYWAGVYAFRYGVFTADRFEKLALAQNLASIGGSFEWLWTFLAAVFGPTLYFAWLARVIPRARGGG